LPNGNVRVSDKANFDEKDIAAPDAASIIPECMRMRLSIMVVLSLASSKRRPAVVDLNRVENELTFETASPCGTRRRYLVPAAISAELMPVRHRANCHSMLLEEVGNRLKRVDGSPR
jgi:hypothetical protein